MVDKGKAAALETARAEDARPVDEKKTTPDEGKTFDKDTIFVCVKDCFHERVRYRKGDEKTGRKCPPYFIVKPAPLEGKK